MGVRMSTSSEWSRHWPIVLGGAIGMGTAFSLYQYVFSLFLEPLTQEFGWTRGQVSIAFALGLVGALLAPVMGRIVDRVGVRPVVTVSTLLLGLGYVGLANMPGELPVFLGLVAFLCVVGTGCGALSYTRAVNSWFVRNRGLALGLTIGGVSVFATIMPPILNWVMESYGWRAGFYTLAGLAVLVGLPIVLSTVWERREAVKAGRAEASAADQQGGEGFSFGQAARTPQYWLLLLIMLLFCGAGVGVISQLAALFTDRGLSQGVAAILLSVFGACVLLGRILTGFLIDRMPPVAVAVVLVGVLPTLGCLFLLDWNAAESVLLLLVAGAVLLGVSQGAELDLVGFFVARRFGLKAYSAIFGSMITALATGSAAGVALFGWSFDATGSYQAALIGAMIAFPLAGLCFLGFAGTRASAA